MTVYDPIATMVHPIDPVATAIEHWYGYAFRKPEPAIYVKGEETPRIKLSAINDYCRVDGHLLTKLDDIFLPVLDKDDVTVINERDILRGLTLYPPELTLFRVLAEESAHDAVQDAFSFKNEHSSRLDAMLQEHMLPEFWNDVHLVDKIQNIFMMGIYEHVADFCNGPTWNMHFVKRVGPDLHIEKADDFRIYEYHRLTRTEYSR